MLVDYLNKHNAFRLKKKTKKTPKKHLSFVFFTLLYSQILPLAVLRVKVKMEWEGSRKEFLNETSIFKSQMRENYSSSDYQTVGIIEIKEKE